MGHSVSIQCAVMKGQPPFKFMWFKNGQELKGKENINILDKISNLMIDPVVKQSAGNYTCTVSNAFGRNSFSSFLKVRGKSIKFQFHKVIFEWKKYNKEN